MLLIFPSFLSKSCLTFILPFFFELYSTDFELYIFHWIAVHNPKAWLLNVASQCRSHYLCKNEFFHFTFTCIEFHIIFYSPVTSFRKFCYSSSLFSSSLLSERTWILCKSFYFLLNVFLVFSFPCHLGSMDLIMDTHRLWWVLWKAVINIFLHPLHPIS